MAQSEPSTGELIRDVAADLQLLVRKELELARTELVEGVTAKVKGAGLAAGAFVLLFPSVMFLSVALALALPGSAAVGFLIVGGLLLVLALGAVLAGLRIFKSSSPGVGATVGSIKEDVRWARGHLKP